MVCMTDVLRARDVFVPGGRPTVTYQSRKHLEEQVSNYLNFGSNEILSISGPTKTGKTVLVRHVVQNALVIEGGQIDTVDDFFAAVLDHFGVATEYQHSAGDETSDGTDRTGRLSAGVAGVDYKRQNVDKSTNSISQTTKRSISVATRDALLSGGIPLVVDDFHYIDSGTQLKIVRFLKSLVFEGLPVIFVSVPHRAYDAVRVETEMTGRVQVLEVGFWLDEDLQKIPREGFKALNVVDNDEKLADSLVRQTFSSPHLMQQFCLGICAENDLPQTASNRRGLHAPVDGWDAFFKKHSSSASKSAFDRLARGRRQRQDRIRRQLSDGRIVDIYGVVLEAIAATGPTVSIRYEDLRASIRRVLASSQPQRNEITQVLEKMSQIAKEDIEGEPVVDWDSEEDVLHISDPYFAFYLRWGSRETVVLHS